MKKLQFHNNKILKLTNVLKYKILLEDESLDLNVVIEQMQSYIRIKGAMQIGPLIQYTRTYLNDNDEMDVEVIIMLQCDRFIHGVENPYSMESLIRVPEALYCRYTGPETFLKFAYDKIYLEAFENDINISDYNYTIFVSENAEEETIIADVFVPRKLTEK